MTVIRTKKTHEERREALQSIEEGDEIWFNYERSKGNLSEYEGRVTEVWVSEWSDTDPTIYVDGTYKLWYNEVRRADGGNYVGKLYKVEKK